VIIYGVGKMAVVGRRPRSDEYSPAISAIHTTAAAAAAAGSGVGYDGARVDAGEEMHVGNHHAPRPHYSDYVQVSSSLSPLQ